MLDNQNIVDGKMKIDGLTQKYLESNGFKIVVDPEGNIGLSGDNVPATEDQIYNNILEFMINEYRTSTEAEIMELAKTTVEVEVTPVPELLPQFIVEEEQPEELPEPVEPEPEPKEEEGFFSSYYNWIFGTTPKEEKKSDSAARPTPTP
jgi:hypothetical protein